MQTLTKRTICFEKTRLNDGLWGYSTPCSPRPIFLMLLGEQVLESAASRKWELVVKRSSGKGPYTFTDSAAGRTPLVGATDFP